MIENFTKAMINRWQGGGERRTGGGGERWTVVTYGTGVERLGDGMVINW